MKPIDDIHLKNYEETINRLKEIVILIKRKKALMRELENAKEFSNPSVA